MAEVIRAADLAQEQINNLEPMSEALDAWLRAANTPFPYKTLLDFVNEALHVASLITPLADSYRTYYLEQLSTLWVPVFAIGETHLMDYLRGRWGVILAEGQVPGPKEIEVWRTLVDEIFNHQKLIRRTILNGEQRTAAITAWSTNFGMLEDVWKDKSN